MAGKAVEHDGGESRNGSVWSRLMERLSFGATLVAVAAFAIFIGWLLGQYAIQTVTGPRLTTDTLERPQTAAALTPGSATGSVPATSTPGTTQTSPTTQTVTPTSTVSNSGTTASQTPVVSTQAPQTSGTTDTSAPSSGGFWRVQAGAFSDRARADSVVSDLHSRGFEAVVTIGAQPVPYRVQVGAFREESRARAIVEELHSAGFEAAVFPPN